MIDPGSHIINRQILDVGYYDQKKSHALQNRLSNLSNHRLNEAIGEVLDKYSGEDTSIRYDRIVLDIGSISEKYLEEELVERVKEELDRFLSHRFTGKKPEQVDDQVSEKEKQLMALEWFLAKGTLPWWAKGKPAFQLSTLINKVVQNELRSFVHVLRKHKTNQEFIQRLVVNFSDENIFNLIRELEPTEAETVIETGKNTIRLQEKEQLVKTDNRTFRNKVWEFILTYLLNDRGSVFNTKIFVRSLLFQLSLFFNIEFRMFLNQVLEAVVDIQSNIGLPHSLPELIKEIYSEEKGGEGNQTSEKSIKQEEDSWLLKQLNNFDQVDDSSMEVIRKLLKVYVEASNTRVIQALDKLVLSGVDITIFELSDKSRSLLKESSVVPEQYYSQSEKELLYNVLERGEESNQVDWLKMLQGLVKSHSAELRSFLFKKGKSQVVRYRIIDALSEPELENLIGLVEPAGKPVVLQFSSNLQNLKEQEVIKVNTSHSDFRKLKWEFILKALLVDRGSQFNLKSFVKSSLFHLAAHFNMSYHALVDVVFAELENKQLPSVSGDLSAVLLEIRKEQLIEEVEISIEESKKEKIAYQLDWIRHLIIEGEEPWWSKKYLLDQKQFQSVLISLSRTDATQLRKVVVPHLMDGEKRRRVLQLLNLEGMLTMVQLIQPSSKESILSYVKILDQVQEKNAHSVSNYDQQKWDTIIFALITDRGSLFNMKSFVLNTLHKLAHHFQLEFEELFIQLVEMCEEVAQSQGSDLISAIKELKEEYFQRKKLEVEVSVELENKEQLALEEWERVKMNFGITNKELFLLFYQFKNQSDWAFIQEKSIAQFLQENSTLSAERLKSLIKYFEFSEQELKKIFGAFTSKHQALWVEMLLTPEKLFVRYYNKDLELIVGMIPELNWLKSLRAIQTQSIIYLLSQTGVGKHDFFKLIMNQLLESGNISKDRLKQLVANAIQELRSQLSSTIELSMAKLDVQELGVSSHEEKKAESLDKKEEEVVEEVLEESKEEEVEEPESGERVHINNAGLVLMWPFITQYFEMLGLTDGKEFNDKLSMARAAMLLQYLVTGEESHPEHELYLNKILCGIPVNTPLDTHVELTDKEKELSESLLGGVIGNWGALKNTSIDGLREGFLQREGVVVHMDDAIQLRVEKKTLDILLDSLPWSYNVVKLPWMENVIQVDWR